MKKVQVFMPVIMLLAKWSGVGIVDGRGKFGGNVASKSRAGATIRTKVTPINRRTAAQSRIRAIFGSFAQTWRTLTASQRNGWNALGNSGLTFTNIFGDTVRQTGSNLYVGCNTNLSLIEEAAITTAPSITATAAGITGVEPLSDVSSTNLFAKTSFIAGGTTVPTGNTLLVFATPKLSPGVSFVKSQLRFLALIDAAADTATENLWTAYTALYGAPAVGDNIVLRVVAINKTSGFAGVGAQDSVTISA